MTTKRGGSPRSTAGPFGIDRRLIAVGLVAGAAVGAWASGRVRGVPQQDTGKGLIDWDQAHDIAINMNRGQTLTELRRSQLDDYYRRRVAECVPLIAEYMGTALPPTLERAFAFDRVDWINANIDAFRRMFAPLEGLTSPDEGERSVAGVLWGGMNRKVVSAELGFLLGYLARRVLGQYDLALLGREPVSSGKLYFVEPNILAVERSLGMPPDQFRIWLALHEATHAFEFEAHPWVRDHFNSMLERYFEFLREDAERLKQGFRGLKTIVERARARGDVSGGWIEALMTTEQRALFQQMQATMCVVEGYSNHVMNVVGRRLLPEYGAIARKFERRQRQRTFAEQLFARLTGLDVKIEQYRLGEAFVNHIVERYGHDLARRLWSGPEYLPTMDEIRRPETWVQRVVGPAALEVGAAGVDVGRLSEGSA